MSLEGYDLKETIAQSAHTLVRRGVRRQDGVKVIIKSLTSAYPSPSELGRLEFEFRILRRLQGCGAVSALGLERDGNRLALVLEDFGGNPLPSFAAGGQAFDAFFAIAIAVTKVVGDVHAQNIIHKDIKPASILLNPVTRELRITDFQSAIELSEEHHVDLSNAFEGSPPYMSPEQTGRMNRDLDYRTDYYSLGVTFFELLTGTLPFTASDVIGWVHCHISKPVVDPRSVNPAIPEMLARLIVKLMAKNPGDRYQSAHGLLSDLQRCQEGWARTRAVESFVLGEQDVSEHFQISHKLIGREPELAKLFDVFRAASRGPAQLLLVAGPAGVGKSALIRELQRSIVDLRGNFIQGKFDQLARNVPYGALLGALGGLVKQLLALPEDQLLAWKTELSGALAQHGQVILDLLPELEQVIGPQLPVPELNPHEARARLKRVFREFIRAVARPEHPLVIFVDDLQWTDSSTPELLAHLLGDDGLGHLLVIGAYRDNEVGEGHLLSLARAQLEAERPLAVKQLSLERLSEVSVQRLVADTVRGDPRLSKPLGDLIWQKTAGNPFFVNELLRMLHGAGAFRFVAGEGRWDWDSEKVASASVSDDVVELMVQRLKRLPPDALELLPLAACLGGEFELATLARVSGKPAGSIATSLAEAARQSVLIPLGSSYRLVKEGNEYDEAGLRELCVRYQFQHDRVQQAAYSLLDPAERARAHLSIGRLLESAPGDEREARIFEIVNHLNLARELITEAEERAQLARHNRRAGERAKRAVAFPIAQKYLETALGLLSTEEWSRDPVAHFDCSRMRVECIFLLGDVQRAGVLCDELISAAGDRLLQGAALELKAQIFEHQARDLEAIDTIRQGLRLFGVELPSTPEEIGPKIGEGIGKMQGHLARTPVEDFVRLPELEDKEKIMTMQLLFQLVAPAIQVNPPLFVLAELIMMDLALSHGTTPVSCKNFADCGILQAGILGDYATAYRLGKVAFAMLERYAPTPLEAGVNFVFGGFLSHWCAGYEEGLDALVRTQRVGLEMGDLQHAAYSHAFHLQHLLLTGRPLSDCRALAESALGYLESLHVVNPLAGTRAVQRVVDKLLRPVMDPELDRQADAAITAQLVAMGNTQWLFSYGQAQVIATFLLGDVAGAAEWHAFTAPHINPGNILFFSLPDHHLFECLILGQGWEQQPEEERATRLDKMAVAEEKLRLWAERSPANFEHKYLLCAAERARLLAAPTDEVIGLYDRAAAATGGAFIHMRALINERQASFWLTKNNPKIAQTFIEEAYYLYQHWGAEAKLRVLERRHPEWLHARLIRATPSTPLETTVTAALDVSSIIKATQAISSEVKAERLFSTLMAAIIENAGAERGCLIFEEEPGPKLYIGARAHVNARELTSGALHIPLGECTEVCPDIVRYVARTSKRVALDDASQHTAHRSDPYIQKNSVKSVLCMPVLNQGKLVAILYAENNAVTHAFPAERLQLLQVIASQAAISITNARLYDSLEDKVIERTRQLAEKSQEVEVMLSNIQQGVFTIDRRLQIAPQYSAHLEQILGAADISGKNCLELLFRGSDVGNDARAAMGAALEFSFDVPAFVAGANASHLVREFQRTTENGEKQYLEADWHPVEGKEGTVYKILVTLRDVTLLQQLKASMAERSRELALIGQILDAGLDEFERFCKGARDQLKENLSVLHSSLPLRGPALELLFRNMHTVKGNARALGATHLVDSLHRAESQYDELRQHPELVGDRHALAASVEVILLLVADYEHICQRKLGNLPRTHTRLEQMKGELHAILGEAESGALSPQQALRNVDRAVSRADSTTLEELVKESAKALPSLARELGKPAPEVLCEGGRVMLTPSWAQVLRGALMHAMRNALDHGIEPAEERRAVGKSAAGRILLCAERAADGVILRLSDDGRGLAVDALRERWSEHVSSDEDAANAVFVSGVSTAAVQTPISGRGVGMDAIRSFIRGQGGDVHIVFTAEREGGHRRFELVFALPETALVREARDSKVPPRLTLHS